jgi:hypothetical protein
MAKWKSQISGMKHATLRIKLDQRKFSVDPGKHHKI